MKPGGKETFNETRGSLLLVKVLYVVVAVLVGFVSVSDPPAGPFARASSFAWPCKPLSGELLMPNAAS